MAVPSVIGADMVRAHGHAMISTAVATLALAAASGHQATAPAAASAIAPTVNQAPKPAPTSASQRDFGLPKIGLCQRLRQMLCDTSRRTRSRSARPRRSPARAHDVASDDATGVCLP